MLVRTEPKFNKRQSSICVKAKKESAKEIRAFNTIGTAGRGGAAVAVERRRHHANRGQLRPS
jgi:hypothetical protein